MELYTLKRDLIYNVCECPPDVVIPHNDVKAWPLYPEYRWVYNKMAICDTQTDEPQSVSFAPVDVMPALTDYPVIVKPIINLKGMGVGSRKIRTPAEYIRMKDTNTADALAGYFWSTYLTGNHYSIDLLVKHGEIVWSAVFQGHLSKLNQPSLFEYFETCPFTVIPDDHRAFIRGWVSTHLKGYTGCVNMETIGNAIIEVHLRMGDLSYLPNRKEVFDAIVQLYQDQPVVLPPPLSVKIYNIPVFIPSKWLTPPYSWLYDVNVSVDDMLGMCGASDADGMVDAESGAAVDILQTDPLDSTSNPVGFVRVANLTCRDLKQGLGIRDRILGLYKIQWIHVLTLCIALVILATSLV